MISDKGRAVFIGEIPVGRGDVGEDEEPQQHQRNQQGVGIVHQQCTAQYPEDIVKVIDMNGVFKKPAAIEFASILRVSLEGLAQELGGGVEDAATDEAK